MAGWVKSTFCLRQGPASEARFLKLKKKVASPMRSSLPLQQRIAGRCGEIVENRQHVKAIVTRMIILHVLIRNTSQLWSASIYSISLGLAHLAMRKGEDLRVSEGKRQVKCQHNRGENQCLQFPDLNCLLHGQKCGFGASEGPEKNTCVVIAK